MQLLSSPPPPANGPLAGLLTGLAQIIEGAKTFLGAVVLSAGLTLNGAVNQMVRITPPNTVSGQGFANPTIWLETTALNQTNLFQIGSGITASTWELAVGWYGGAGAALVSVRAQGLYFSGPSGAFFAPFSPDSLDLGTTSNYWRSLHATSTLLKNGTLAAPSYSFAGDTDTGFFWQQSGGIVLSANGVRQWRTNGSSLLYLADDARWLDLSIGQFNDAYGGSAGLGGNGVAASLKGAPNDGATAKGAVIGSGVALANATAKTVSVVNAGTEVAAFDKDGAVQLNIAGGTRPAASVDHRGKLWYSKNGAAVADTISVCLKSAADTYSWVTISTG